MSSASINCLKAVISRNVSNSSTTKSRSFRIGATWSRSHNGVSANENEKIYDMNEISLKWITFSRTHTMGFCFVGLLTVTMLFCVGNRCVQCVINIWAILKGGKSNTLIDKVLVLETSSTNTHTQTRQASLFFSVHLKSKQTAVDSFSFCVCCNMVESGLDTISSSRLWLVYACMQFIVYGPDCVFVSFWCH